MIVANPALEQLLPELLGLLENHASMLEQRLVQLQQLSKALLDRKQDEMESLLDRMEQDQHQQQLAEVRLASMRTTLAKAVDTPVQHFKLSQLLPLLAQRDAAQLQLRRQHVIDLAQRLRSEHLHAAVLLSEASRVNRMMLEALLGSATVTTYGQGGTKSYDQRHGVVNAER